VGEVAAAGAERAAGEAAGSVTALKQRVADLEDQLRAARAGTREAEAAQRAARDRTRDAARHLREARRHASAAQARADRLADEDG
jgi:chromosome segregation ATPase